MLKQTLILISLFFSIATYHAQVLDWAGSLDGTDSQSIQNFATDDEGNFYTTGYFNGNTNFNLFELESVEYSSGFQDFFLAKYSSSGELIWTNTLSSTDRIEGIDIEVDNFGNVFCTGVFQGTVDFDPSDGTTNLTSSNLFDIFIVKFTTDGNFVWVKQLENTLGDASSLTIDNDGNVYTTGSVMGYIDFNPNEGTYMINAEIDDVFIWKLSNDGDFIWAKTLENGNLDDGRSINIDNNGNVVICGLFKETVDFDPSEEVYNLTSNGERDAFILKLNSNGEFLWAKIFGSSGNESAEDFCIDGSNNIFTIGFFYETVDFDPSDGVFNLTSVSYGDMYIQKLDENGSFLWAKRMGGNENDYANTITNDQFGNIYIGGSYYSDCDLDPNTAENIFTAEGTNRDMYFQKLSPQGNLMWVYSLHSEGYNNIFDMDFDITGNLIICGLFTGTVDFDFGGGENEISTIGGSGFDGFIMKLKDINPHSDIESINQDFNFSVFPNPVSDFVNIKTSSSDYNQEITLSNSLGQIVYRAMVTKNNKVAIDVSKFEVGVYYLKLKRKDGGVFIEKLVIEH